MFKHILVATDGSELSNKGIDAAINLAKTLGAQLAVVTVTNPVPSYGTPVSAEWVASPETIKEYSEEMDQEAKHILNAAKDLAHQAGLKRIKAIHSEHELPSHGIFDAAKKYNADLIIIASHGRRGLKKLLLGSQAEELLAISDVPVLILKDNN